MHHDDTTTCYATPKDKEPHVNAHRRPKTIPTFPKDENHTTNAPRRRTNMLRDSERLGTTCECTPTTQKDFLRFQRTRTTWRMHQDDTPACYATPKDKEPHVNAHSRRKTIPTFQRRELHDECITTKNIMLRESDRRGTTSECTSTTHKDPNIAIGRGPHDDTARR